MGVSVVDLFETIGAALIAGLVSLLALIISKEQKVSDLRQAWIDALRDDVSEYVSHAMYLTSSSASRFSIREAVEQRAMSYIQLRKLDARIRLRLNPLKDESKPVLASLRDVVRLIQEGNFEDTLFQSTTDDLVEHTQPVLKRHWEKVKRGELGFNA